jgi:hypothetical protein
MGWMDQDLDELHCMACLQDAQDAMTFITALHKASLDDSFARLPPEALNRLWNPPRALPDITDPDLLMSLKLFFADTTIKAYDLICAAITE